MLLRWQNEAVFVSSVDRFVSRDVRNKDLICQIESNQINKLIFESNQIELRIKLNRIKLN